MKKHFGIVVAMIVFVSGLAACEGVHPADEALPTVEGAQILVLEDDQGNLYDLEYMADLTPDQMAAVMNVGLTDDNGNDLPALQPIVNEYLAPEEIPAVESMGIIALRPHVQGVDGDVVAIRSAVTVNGLNGAWASFSRSISTSGAWATTCHYVSGVIAATGILASPSGADFDLYLYGNSSCSGSAIGSATSGSAGQLDLHRWTSTSNWSSNPRKTVGYRVKSYSGRGTYTLKVAYYGYY
jgi:hypothetical protein